MANNDQINEVYYRKVFDENTQRLTRERVHWICTQVTGQKVLDIGCSQGIVSILLGRTGFDVMGMDIESGAIEYACNELQQEENQVREKVEFIHNNALTYDFGVDKFDTVIAAEIIEHLIQQHLLYEKIFKILKPNGRVIITAPFGIADFHDHKKTYCLSLLLKEVYPYFTTQQVHFIGKWICLAAGRRNKITHRKISSIDCNLVEQAENRFIGNEQYLMDINKAYLEKNKQLLAQIDLLKKGRKKKV